MNDAPVRVLLVEDDLFFAARILSVLRKMGCEVERATYLEDALEKTRNRDPDVVILSFASKRLGGIESIRMLKSQAGARRILSYLSHVKIPEVRDAVLAAGADRIVPNSAITMRLPDILGRVLRGEPVLAGEGDE